MFRPGGETKAKLLYSPLLLSLIVMLPVAVCAESPTPLRDGTNMLLEQLWDFELMRRNVEECYRAEKSALMPTNWSEQARSDDVKLDGELMNQVLGYLVGSPEYERFIAAYRRLVRRPDYRRLYTDELFAEYMRLLESGRTRLLTRLSECQNASVENASAQAQEVVVNSVPVKTIALGHAESSPRTAGGRVAATRLLKTQILQSGSIVLAVRRIGVSSIVLQIGRSASAGADPSAVDMVELYIFVPRERSAPAGKKCLGLSPRSGQGGSVGNPYESPFLGCGC